MVEVLQDSLLDNLGICSCSCLFCQKYQKLLALLPGLLERIGLAPGFFHTKLNVRSCHPPLEEFHARGSLGFSPCTADSRQANDSELGACR